MMTLKYATLLANGFFITVVTFGAFAPLFGYKPSDNVSIIAGVIGAVSFIMIDKSKFIKRFL